MNDSSELLRGFLFEHFSDGELAALCFAHFQAVSADFSDGMSKHAKIQRLIEYCHASEQLPQLVKAINDARPGQLESYLGAVAKDITPAKAKRSEPPTVWIGGLLLATLLLVVIYLLTHSTLTLAMLVLILILVG